MEGEERRAAGVAAHYDPDLAVSTFPYVFLSAIILAQVSLLTIELDMLVTEPVVFFFSLWVSFSWATLYLQFSSVPLVFRTNHGFNVEQTGAVFTGKLTTALPLL